MLAPEDHAAALEAMRRHGRHPISMSMAQPDQERPVPACDQHAVLDVRETQALTALLPIHRRG